MISKEYLLALVALLILTGIGCTNGPGELTAEQLPGDEGQRQEATAQQPEETPTSTLAKPSASNPPILPTMGVAPEIENEIWINSDVPLSLASQSGKVVLLEFWTFGCINCQRVIPFLREWHDTYAGDNLQVIAVHYPEFAYERELANVQEAIKRFEITYPVALDNEGLTWRAYHQRYWPTTYLIDKAGRIRYKHIGEFNERSAAEARQAIEVLLAEPTE